MKLGNLLLKSAERPTGMTKLAASLPAKTACELCTPTSDTLLWTDAYCRVILVGGEEGKAWPGFCRVVWQAHAAEMSDLAPAERNHLMNVVYAVESALRELLQPDKINLASLGNVVPHLHWHVIPRWQDDRNFPRPIWAEALRPDPQRPLPSLPLLKQAINHSIAAMEMPKDE